MKWTVYALLAICMAASWLSDICSWKASAAVCSYILLGLIFDAKHINRPVLNRILGIVLFAALLYLDAAEAEGLQGRFLHLCLDMIWALLGFRALSHEKTAERVQVAILSMIPLVCMAYVLPATVFLVFLLAYFVVLFAGLAMQSLAAPTTGSAAGMLQKSSVPPNLVGSKKFWFKTALLFLIPIILGWGLFFVIPRNNVNAGVPGLGPQIISFPDVSLNKTGKIDLDPSLVFRAELPENPNGYYWRVEVQNNFDGTTWQSHYSARTLPQRSRDMADAHRLEFVKEWRDHRLPSLSNTVWIEPGEGVDVAELRLYSDQAGGWHRFGWKRGNPLTEIVFWQEEPPRPEEWVIKFWDSRFSVTGLRHFSEYRGMIWPSRRDRNAAKKLTELAQNIVGDASTDYEKAKRIQQYLKSNYRYSLERPVREGNVVEDFLYRQKFGHCEVFSTVMAVLVNRLRIPVRNVTGFVSNEFRDGYNLVRSAHAHSWVEVNIEGQWIVFDPTPSGAAQVKVDWLQRIDDWFASYQPRSLYLWFAANWRVCLGSILALMLLIALGMVPVKAVRRRLLPTEQVWKMAWTEVLSACQKNPSTSHLAVRTAESWWEQESPELEPIQTFARAYVHARYGMRPDELRSGFVENCRIWREVRRVRKFLFHFKQRR